MNKTTSYILIILGIMITGFGWILGSSEVSLIGGFFAGMGWIAILALSIIPGTLLVWWGGLFGRLIMPLWLRIILIILYIGGVILSLTILALMIYGFS